MIFLGFSCSTHAGFGWRPTLFLLLSLSLSFPWIQVLLQPDMAACWYNYGNKYIENGDNGGGNSNNNICLTNAQEKVAGERTNKTSSVATNLHNNSGSSGGGVIPHILYFTHKENILQTKQPPHVYENVLNTINLYERAWSNDNDARDNGETSRTPAAAGVDVRFLDNIACAVLVNATEPRLLPYFLQEHAGKYRADICRVAALYLTGGYYFDVDMKTVQPWTAEDHEHCTFFTARPEGDDQGGEQGTRRRQQQPPKPLFFQSILVATPGHAVLRRALRTMLEHYRARRYLDWHAHHLMGPKTLFRAHEEIGHSQTEPKCELGEEINLMTRDLLYPNLTRSTGRGGLCNMVVHVASERSVYFVSRIPGAGQFCAM